MGKRSKKRKTRRKHGKRPDCRSDSELPRASRSEDTCCGWTSWDEAALVDYTENATSQCSAQDELEVTRRLGSLNVSLVPCCNHPDMFIVSTPQDTTVQVDAYSEQLSGTPLEELPGERAQGCEKRQSRKRNTRKRSTHHRPTKRPKGPRLCSLDVSDHTMFMGKFRRPSVSSIRYNPIGCRRGSASPGADRGPLVRGGTEVWSDASSRAGLLTESSSTPEDADMDHDTTEDASEEFTGMDAQDSTCLSVDNDCQICSESDITSTSDSGCEGDDEESSVEVFNKMAIWSENEYHVPSHDHYTDLDTDFDQILTGSYPLLSDEGQKMVQELGKGEEFKHPQRFGIIGSRGRKRRRKKPPLYPSSAPSPTEINQLMAGFVASGKEQVQLPLVSRSLCHVVSSLAQLYRLQCLQQQQKRCLPVIPHLLKRTPFTKMATQSDIESVLVVSSTKHRSGVQKSSVLSSSSPMVVGSSAEPLDEMNVGNKMLQDMGWKPGNGLGPRGDGIKEPVSAHLRPRYAGLGFSQ